MSVCKVCEKQHRPNIVIEAIDTNVFKQLGSMASYYDMTREELVKALVESYFLDRPNHVSK